MKKLSQLFSKKEILTADEASEVKGGRRFIAHTHRKALKKMARLIARGKTPVMRDLGDHYCIEW